MLNRLTANLSFQGQALALRAERQQVLSSNIANADTPGYQARDMDFAAALARQAGPAASGAGAAGLALRTAAGAPAAGLAATDARHLHGAGGARGSALLYRTPEQASGDNNTVDMDRERANFADNAVRYEATLRFINSGVRQTLSAIRGE